MYKNKTEGNLKEIETPAIINIDYIKNILSNYLELCNIMSEEGILSLHNYLEDKDITKPYYKELNTYLNGFKEKMTGTLENELSLYIFENYTPIIYEINDCADYINDIIDIITKYYKMSKTDKECIKKQIYKEYVNRLLNVFSVLTENKYTEYLDNTISKLLNVSHLERGKVKPLLLQVKNNETIDVSLFEGDLLDYMINKYNKIDGNKYINDIIDLCKQWIDIDFSNDYDFIKEILKNIYN